MIVDPVERAAIVAEVAAQRQNASTFAAPPTAAARTSQNSKRHRRRTSPDMVDCGTSAVMLAPSAVANAPPEPRLREHHVRSARTRVTACCFAMCAPQP